MGYGSAPLLALVAVWFLNALWPLVGASGLHLYAPLLFAEASFIAGFLFLLPGLIAKRGWENFVSRDLLLNFLGIGFFYGIPSFLYIAALGYTTPSSAGIVAEMEVLYSMILSTWLLRESIGVRQAVASLMVVSGTALILTHDLGSAKWKGDLMIAGSAWMYQVSHVLVKRLPERLTAFEIACGRIFYEAAIFILPVLAWSWLHPARPQWTWSWPGVGLLFLEGAGIIALAGFLWYAAIRKMDLAKCTAFVLSYPALTMLLSWALGWEAISLLQIEGLVITLSGAAWLSWLMAAPKPSAADAAAGTFPAARS